MIEVQTPDFAVCTTKDQLLWNNISLRFTSCISHIPVLLLILIILF